MVPDQSPHLRLILDGNSTTTVWSPEDNLHGHLELSSKEEVHILGITIYFEGVSRNWIADASVSDSRIIKAERKFLSQAHDILQPNVSQSISPSGMFIYEAPFHFIAPRRIPPTNPDSPDQCLQLPPSLELGESFIDESTGKRFAQPSITYYLRAAVEVIIGGFGGNKSLETFLAVIIAPYTEELPPTAIDDFPLEFEEQQSKLLRRSLIGGVLGTMKASLQEPPALRYGTSSRHSVTNAVMKLEYESTSLGDVQKTLQGLSFKVYSLVRVKTFYSVKSFPRLPSQSLLGLRSETRLRDGVIKLETQLVQNASWGYRFNLDRETSAAPASPNGSSRLFEGVLEQHKTQSFKSDGPNGKWLSYWTIPIEVNGRLLPTFCSSLVARLYSLIVRVKVAGARAEFFDLEVPLQVIHTSIGKTKSPTVEPIQEQLLEYRSDSETFRFGDEPLGFEQDPPQYYP